LLTGWSGLVLATHRRPDIEPSFRGPRGRATAAGKRQRAGRSRRLLAIRRHARHERSGTCPRHLCAPRGLSAPSQYVEEAYALDLLAETTESTGHLLEDRVADVQSFVDAVQRVANGGSALDPEVVALLSAAGGARARSPR
jgi:hypothetical protein